MSVYTVHQPPLRAYDDPPSAERFAFVREGFSFWAFLLGPLWMLWHRMWLVLIGYLVVTIGLQAVLRVLDASQAAMAGVGLVIAILVGLEASTLRRFTLRRRRWNNVGLVTGDDLEDAERRFFDTWLKRTSRAAAAGPAVAVPPVSAASIPHVSQHGGVIGLFPEPGTHR